MNTETNENISKDELEKHIEELRDILNKICATAQDAEGMKKRLNISEDLDQLIVKYMKENYK